MLPRILALLASAASAAVNSNRQTTSAVCQQIAGSISGTVYSDPLSVNFINDTGHYMTSSSQTPTCVVEVANAQDVSTVLKIVGQTRTPFAVKSGGHASNPGFSSTPGVFISLVRLNRVTLSGDKKTIEIGTGNHWTDVYNALDGSGVNVVGGRVTGPGVGGFSLGGGYSWLTDQYGLTCDTVVAFNLVLPNGTITRVDSTKSDLFFALKGGLNRFGVVTSIVFHTFPQPAQVYGGIRVYPTASMPSLINATNTFQSQNTDPKAQVILTVSGGVTASAVLILFYDGPSSPPSFAPYDAVLPAPLLATDKTQTFASFASSTPSEAESGQRGAFHTMMTTGLTPTFMNAVYNESVFYGAIALAGGSTYVSYDIEPFLPYGKHATNSAFPHANSPLPLNLFFNWLLAADDAFWRGAMQQSINHLISVAKAEGIYVDGAYPNYALDTYTGPQLYGTTNAARLRAIQAKIDPSHVMELAGGFNL